MPAHTSRVILTTALAAAVLSACGSSSAPSHSTGYDVGLRFSDCMRSHGVSNFPDPSPGGGIQIPTGANPKAPAFESAQKACAHLLPALGGRGPGSEARKLELLRLARCMRAHGVPSFPDPTSSPPAGPPPGGGIAFGGPGSFIAVPQSLIQSPAFEHAAGVCGFPGAGHRAKIA